MGRPKGTYSQAYRLVELYERLFAGSRCAPGGSRYLRNPDLLRELGEMVDGLLLKSPIKVEYLSPKRRKSGTNLRTYACKRSA